MAYNKITMDNNLKSVYDKLKYAHSLSLIMLDIDDAMTCFANIKNQEFEGNAKEEIMAMVQKISLNYEKIKGAVEKIILATNKTNNNLYSLLENLDKKIEDYNDHVDKYNALEIQKNNLLAAKRNEDNYYAE